MDFERSAVALIPELDDFRREVREWVDANVPDNLKAPIDEELGGLYPEEDHPVERAFGMELRRKLGQKRWLYPTYPTEYGGGGLSRNHALVIQQELARKNPPLMWAVATDLLLGGLMVWATEEQRAELLPGMLSGEINCIETFTEPHGGSDLANVKSRAVRDGEDWVLNGQKTFVTAPPNIGDLLYGPFMTDPDSPRHRNLGFFWIPRNAPGVTIIPLRLLNGINQNFVIYDTVRVPANHLIGGDHQGWQVVQSVLEAEHGSAPTSAGGERGDNMPLQNFVASGIRSVKDDAVLQERLAEVYIESRIASLFRSRNVSLYQTHGEISYEGSQTSAWSKEIGVRNSERIRDIMGPYALVHHKDPLSPDGGWAERQQRGSLVGLHPAGTYDVQKVIVARRLGLSRTQERPAPTAAVAT